MGNIDATHATRSKVMSFKAKLSIVDQSVPLIWAHDVYGFECSEPDLGVQALQKGLDVTVMQLPFLAGEVYEDPTDRNCAVIEWSEYRPRVILEQLDPGKLPGIDELKQRKAPLHTMEYDSRPPNTRDHSVLGHRQAVLAVSYSKIKGGIVLGVAIQHTFMDGFGIRRIWKKWAYNTSKAGQDVVIGLREPLTRYERLNRAVRFARERLLAEQRWAPPKKDNSSCQLTEAVPSLPPPVLTATTKIFFVSAQKLHQLGESIRGHISQPFSRNTLIAALLWQTISIVRIRRLSNEMDLSQHTPTSEAKLVVDSRAILDEVLPGANDWIGNLALELLPPLIFPLRTFSDRLINLGEDDAAKQGCGLKYPQSLPKIVKRLASTYSNFALNEVAFSLDSKLRQVEAADFDFRSLRMPEMALNGLQLIVTNVSNFEPFHDFGPHLGRALFMRHVSGSIDGMVIVMPLRRGAHFSDNEKDEIEIVVFLREDDMEQLCLEETWSQLWCADPV